MEDLNLAPILVPFAALLIGWAIGFFDSNLRTSKKIKQAEASAEIAIKEAKDKTAGAEARLASISAMPVGVDDPGILRIKNENGSLTLDLDGARVDTNAFTPEHRKRLIEIVTILRPWLEGRSGPAPAATPSPIMPPAPPPVPSGTSAAPISAQAVTGQPTDKTPNKSAPVSKKDEKPAPATSMVGQINEILQLRIANTNLAAKGVTMIESPSGAVNVYIGIDRYEGLDAVPDEEVKAAIRSAIAEWEKKYTPGL